MTFPDDNAQGPADTAPDTSVDTQLNSGFTDPTQQDQPTEAPDAPWKSYVEKFPTSLHGTAEEVFKEWDGNVTKRFQDLHSTYQPYKEYVDEWEPSAIGQAIALAQALESDPEAFYKALATSYGFAESEQGAANQLPQQTEVPPPGFGEEDSPWAPRLDQQEQLLSSLADYIIGQENAKKEQTEFAQQDQWLNQTMDTLKQQHGAFDEGYVMQAIASGVDPEAAVTQFQSLVSSWATRQNAPSANAPTIMGASGGLPSAQVDPSTLSNADTKNLVAEYLRKAAEGG